MKRRKPGQLPLEARPTTTASWSALPVGCRDEVVRLLIRLLAEHVGRRLDRGEDGDE